MPGLHFLSPVDLTYTPLVATCAKTEHADVAQLGADWAKAALEILGWLSGL